MKDDNKTWSEYYAKRKFSITNVILHYPYLIKIFFCNPKRLCEIGCGPAQHAFFIKKILPKSKVSVLDLDKDILERIRKNNSNKIEHIYNINILNKSETVTLPKFNMVISQGLMEHFNDSDFIQIINNFAPISEKMIFSVPSDIYQNQDYGNEILRSKREIEKLLKNCKFKFKVNNYPFDIGIRTKINLIKKNKYGLLKSLNLFLFESCQILVKIDYSISNYH